MSSRQVFFGALVGAALHVVLLVSIITAAGAATEARSPGKIGELMAWTLVLASFTSPGGAILGMVAAALAAGGRRSTLAVSAVGAGVGAGLGLPVLLALLALSPDNVVIGAGLLVLLALIGFVIAGLVARWSRPRG